MADFKVRFDFVSSRADGNGYTRTVTVKARNAREAESAAWRNRVSYFGAVGNDNATDCHVIEEK